MLDTVKLGETPGEGFPSFWLCQKFTLSCALER